MSTRTIGIAVLIIIVLAVGGYFAYTSMAQEPATGNNEQVTNQELPSDQVQAQEVTVGTGAEAKPGDTVYVLYTGQFPDGTVFDSSEAHGNEPLKFVLGDPGLIAGFQIGVNGMKEGGERLIAVPAALGYGSEDVKNPEGETVIPANSTLVFRLKLVKVEPATTTATQ